MTQAEVYDDREKRDTRFSELKTKGHRAVFKFSSCRPVEPAFEALPNYAGRQVHALVKDSGYGHIVHHGRIRRRYVSTWSVSWSD